jgi:predicted Fe-Mo cluster-binding NifX family protein
VKEKGMRLAVAIWDSEVSPVFDFAHRIMVVDCDEECRKRRYRYQLPDESMTSRAERLRELGVNVLICGAISNALAEMVKGLDITLIPWKCGLIEEVLLAYFSGTLEDPRFSMPGSNNGSTIEIKSEPIERREAL